jgi:hypothetical protein
VRVTRALVLVIAAARAASAEPNVTLHAPAECPDVRALDAAIARRLDVPIERVALVADVTIEATHDGFVAHVHGDESRELASASCAELTDAVAVIVARTATEVHIEPPSAAETKVVVAAPVVAAPSLWNGGVRLSGLFGTGSVSELGLGGEVAAFASRGEASIELAGSRWLAGTAETGVAGIEISFEAIALRAGWRGEHVRAWSIVELGRVYGRGVGLDHAGEGTARSLAVGGGAAYAVPLAEHFAAVAAGEVEMAVERVTFAQSSGGVLYEMPALAIRGRIGLELDWR